MSHPPQAPQETIPARPIPRRLSPTALARYRRCEAQFAFAHVDKVPLPQADSPILAQGNALHHALERGLGLGAADRTAENLHRALRSVWRRHKTLSTFVDRDEEASYGNAALQMLTRLTEHMDLAALEVVARERWCSARLSNGFEIYGRLDLVARLPSGALQVLDWKTGKAAVDSQSLPQEPAAQVYLLAGESTFAAVGVIERVSLVYLGQPSVPISRWEVEREDVEATKAALVALTDEIAADHEFPAQPGGACHYCPFALNGVCPDAHRVSIDDLQVPDDVLF
jgi:putative RecB family exonuclease